MEKTPLPWSKLGEHFTDEDKAREYMEFLRWGNNGPACPHCGGADPYRLTPKPGSKTRPGVLKCRECRKQFTVTVGTVFEDSHIKLTKWLQAIYLIGASKKGISAHQIHRMLGVTYRSAWFMAHRFRYAMSAEPLATKLSGTVEIDEGYIGGKRKGGRRPADGGRKAAVAVLVEGGGKVRAMPMERMPMERIDGASMEREIRNYVDSGSRLMTDETNIYHGINVKGQQQIAGMERQSVNHGSGEFVRGDVHTNTAEGFISLLKRGIVGTFHHVGKGHLGKYVSEFEFRYNARKLADKDRPARIVQGGEGKRLTYKQPVGASAN